jgi:ketosteroid isomerase-like protein
MSTSPNIALVRRVLGAFASRDLAEMEKLCLPDAEFDWSRRLLDGQVIRGIDGLRKFFDETLGIFEEVSFEEEEAIELADDRVLVVALVSFRGRTSGVPVQARGATVWTIRDGKIAQFRFYQSKGDALADVEGAEAVPPDAEPQTWRMRT